MAEISNEQRQQIIAEYMKTAGGRAKLAASMTQPLRLRRDYTSVGRKTFLVEQLPDGAQPVYDKDIGVTAYVIGEEGQNILAIAKSRRVSFPLFEIASNPELPLSQVKERRFDTIERAQDLAKAEIQAEEDTRVFEILDAVATTGFDNIGATNPDIPASAPLTASDLSDAYAQVQQHDLPVARVFMNALDYNDIRKWNRDVLDIETQGALLKTGLLANIWGAQVIVSRRVPQGYIYVCSDPEFVGRIPVRTELTVLSADDPRNRTIGFSVFEHLGIGCHNPLAICRVVLSR